MAGITMTPVRSTDLKAIGHNPETSILHITFGDGSTYGYSGVPRVIFDGLENTASKGQYFYRHIKKGGSHQEGRLRIGKDRFSDRVEANFHRLMHVKWSLA